MDERMPMRQESELPPFFYRLLCAEDPEVHPLHPLPTTKRAKIVMLHGVFMDHCCWLQTASKLREWYGHSVLLLDFYSHGKSPTLPDYKQMDVQTLVQQVQKAIHLVGWQHDQVVLSGLSLGGCVSLALTQQFPQQVKRVVLFAPTGLSEHKPLALSNQLSEVVRGLLQIVDLMQQKLMFMQQLVQWRGIRWLLGIGHLMRLLPTFGLDQEALEQVFKHKAPVVVYAENDWFLSAQRERLQKIHKDIKVIVIPRVGHMEFCLTLNKHKFHMEQDFWQLDMQPQPVETDSSKRIDRLDEDSASWRQNQETAMEMAAARAF